MHIKKFNFKKIIAILLLFALSLIFILYFPNILSPISKPKINQYPDAFTFQLDISDQYRQSLNNCGSYSTAAAFNVFNKNSYNPEKIASEIGFKVKDRFTLPIGVERYLKDRNFEVANNNAIGLSNNEKIDYLKSMISSKMVGIILIKLPKTSFYYLHYITLVGYDKDKFFIYDSLAPKNSSDTKYTLDQNADEPGNKTVFADDLIEMWNNGNILNYPKNWNIFVKPV